MRSTCQRLSSAVVLLCVAGGALVVAKDRIFVDQWSPTRSELYIADADGTNARKLVPGTHIDYNASFSYDGQWVVFTSERNGSADIYRVRTTGMELERLTDDAAFRTARRPVGTDQGPVAWARRLGRGDRGGQSAVRRGGTAIVPGCHGAICRSGSVRGQRSTLGSAVGPKAVSGSGCSSISQPTTNTR